MRHPDNAFDQHCRKHPGAQNGHFMIAYRPSMLKYEGGPTVLELNNHNSPPSAARLNVQFMALLLTLGVPFEVFARLVQDQLDLIANILTDREKALQYIRGEPDAAAEDDFLQGRESFPLFRSLYRAHSSIVVYAMLLAQHDLSEPHVRHRLQSFQNTQYATLRNKMSLRVPESAYLFGVVDEEGVLKPDEVYVNLPGRSGVLVRDVIVARYDRRSLPVSAGLTSNFVLGTLVTTPAVSSSSIRDVAPLSNIACRLSEASCGGPPLSTTPQGLHR